MGRYPQAAKIAMYRSVATEGGVAGADAFQLICMLMDGALERLAAARGCIERKEKIQKAALLHRVVEIVQELQVSLDHNAGGEIAANLDRLYDYITRRVMTANLEDNLEIIDEVTTLLQNIRRAWAAIPAEARAQAKGAAG
jgi:flagellar secretion chaperone FliS